MLPTKAEIEQIETLHKMTFHLASNSDDLKLFIEHLNNPKFNISFVDHNANNLLHITTKNNNTLFTKELIERKIPVNLQNIDGNTPLHFCAQNNNREILNLLSAKKLDTIIDNNLGLMPIELTTDSVIYEYLLVQLNIFFLISVNLENIFSIIYSLGKGADINFTDTNYNNALHLAVDKQSIPIIKLLLDSDIAINSYNIDKMTPLHIAAKIGNFDIVKEIVSQKNVHLNIQDVYEQTALHYALRNKTLSSIKIVKLLLEKGADPFITPSQDVSLLYKASFFGLKEILQEILSKRHESINEQNNIYKFSALHATAVTNALEITYFLVHEGIDISLKSIENKTAQKLAFENEFEEISQYLKNNAINLISAAANGKLDLVKKYLPRTKINISEKFGYKSIDIAAKFGHYQVVNFLLNKGASLKPSKDEKSNTALHLAAQENHCEVVELLIEKGKANPYEVNLSGKTAIDLSDECF